MLRLLLSLPVVAVFFVGPMFPSMVYGWDEEAHSPDQIKFFETEIKPILIENCFKCHGGKGKPKGGLTLTSRKGLLSGGDTGPAVSLESPESPTSASESVSSPPPQATAKSASMAKRAGTTRRRRAVMEPPWSRREPVRLCLVV